MSQERLYIENNWIPLSGSLNPSITKSITDISEPQDRKATYSKTVQIPRSKEADKVFTHLFEFNITTGLFNTSARADVRYEVDSEIILEGYIRLNSIGRTNNNEITYDCTMFSTSADFMAALSNGYMTDLYESVGSFEGLDIYDHQLTKEIQQLSWEDEIIINGSLEPFEFGQGYVYPLIDYGFSTDATNFIFTQIPVAIYEKEYFLRAISWAGYTLKSGGWVDTDDVINHLIIPASPEIYQLTAEDIEDREFAANTPEFDSTGTTTSGNLPIGSFSPEDLVIFTNEVVDAGGNYDPANGQFEVVSAGVYDLITSLDISATFTPSTGTAVKTTCDVHGFITLWHTPVSTGTPVQLDSMPFYITSDDSSFTTGARSTSSTPTYPDTDYMSGKAWGQIFPTAPVARPVNPPDRYILVANGVPLQPGDIVEVKVKSGVFAESTNTIAYVSSNNLFVDALSTYYSGNATITCSVGSFYNKVANNTMTEGNTLQILDAIPKNVKLSDYFRSMIRRFNLVVDVNPLNPKELIIETKNNYYDNTTANAINIHELIDRSKPIKSEFINSLGIKRYLYHFKEDKDYWNEKYTFDKQATYGDRQVDVQTEFSTQDKKTEVIFSPTCMVALPNQDRVLPTIYAVDEYNQPKTTKHNIRSLYYAGLKPCTNAWGHTNYVSVFGIPDTDYYTEYPYAGHWDDPFNPTLDINFGLVKEVYYDDNIYSIVATNNNLVNKYHAKDLRQLTDPESRIVKCHVKLSPYNFQRFTFDKLYYWDYAYWRLQEIADYNPVSYETTQCTFLKLVDVPDFVATTPTLDGKPQTIEPDQTGGNVDMSEETPAKGVRAYDQPDNNTYTNRTVKVVGEYNYVNASAKHIDINGDSNKVFAEAKNISIHGDENIIMPGVENVVLINTSNLTITESDVTYINGLKSDSLDNGTYTPTDSANANLDSCTPGAALYSKNGNIVVVSGYFDADPTTTNTSTVFEIDLPIPSNITSVEEVSGTATSGAAQFESVQISGSTANNTAVFTWVARATSNNRWFYIFQYKIN